MRVRSQCKIEWSTFKLLTTGVNMTVLSSVYRDKRNAEANRWYMNFALAFLSAFARYRGQLIRLHHRGFYGESYQVWKIKIYEKIINRRGVISSGWGQRKTQKLTPRIKFRIFFPAYFMKLKLLSPFDEEVKNISSVVKRSL